MAPPKTRARDRSSLRHYRIELPNLIDDLGLSVYAFRLYVHLKRVAEDEGSCWQSARTLATVCNMSSGKVSEAKDELAQKGLIARHPKILRGGVGDDITIVDIWPLNFKHYAPESGAPQESDHHTITSDVEVITTRSLDESDHHTITSEESDHLVIAETIKRSPGDTKKDQYHIESQHGGGDGDRRTLGFLIDVGIGAASEFAHFPFEPTKQDYSNRRADNQTNAIIVKAWRNNPPTKDYHYEQQRPLQSDVSPDRPRRSAARGTHNGTGGSDLKDPGWRERLIAQAENGELP